MLFTNAGAAVGVEDPERLRELNACRFVHNSDKLHPDRPEPAAEGRFEDVACGHPDGADQGP